MDADGLAVRTGFLNIPFRLETALPSHLLEGTSAISYSLLRSSELTMAWPFQRRSCSPVTFYPGPPTQSYDRLRDPVYKMQNRMQCGGVGVTYSASLLSIMLAWRCSFALLFAAYGLCSAPSGPWDKFHYAPASRVVRPAAVKKTVGNVKHAKNLVKPFGGATFSGNQSWVTLDFGIEVRASPGMRVCVSLTHLRQVGGLISLNFNKVENTSGLALSFTESPLYISPISSDDSSHSALNNSFDGVFDVATPLKLGFWTQPPPTMRGGFRYLTLVSTGTAPITISNITCEISFSPHIENLRDYSGYFYASDPVFHDKDFLTKVCRLSSSFLVGD